MIDLVTLYSSIINTKSEKMEFIEHLAFKNSAGCVGFRNNKKDLVDYRIVTLIKKRKNNENINCIDST
tara:strand:+ start:468 stop:671 length:204 start_codon:yes stop_codon:yes gene_type:complete